MEPRTKQQLLDEIERQTLIVAGEVALAKIMGLRPNVTQMENALGEVLDATLELKKIEGVPSNLSKSIPEH